MLGTGHAQHVGEDPLPLVELGSPGGTRRESRRTAFGPCAAAGGEHELLALLRTHHLLYPARFPQSRRMDTLLRVFVVYLARMFLRSQ